MIYKAVIIDDNQNTVQSLKYGIDWNSLGLEVAGTAFDGQQGKNMIEEVRPDIIITDIHMPLLDGLSMVEAALTVMPDSKVIVITGYDSIQYAARAIKLSVFDYIFKPIDDKELLTALERAVKVIRANESEKGKQNRLLKGRLIYNLVSGENLTVEGILRDVEGRGFCRMLVASLEEGFSQPLMQKIEESEILSRSFHIVTLLEEKLVLLCVSHDSPEQWEHYQEEIVCFLRENAPEIQIGSSKIYSTEIFLKKIYIEAYENMISQFADEKEKLLCSSSKEHTSVADMQSEATKLAEEISGSADFEKTYEIFNRCTGGSIISLQIMTIMYCTKVLQTHRKWAEDLDPVIYKSTQNMTMDMFGQWLKTFLEAVDGIREGDKGKSKLISEVLRYMEDHVLENKKLEQVAGQFYVSPNYLSSMIRKETGITFQQHVLNNKMELSKKLLDDTRMRVEEIAHMVGYENYVSFYNVFKRLVGITPSEYRFRRKD